MQKYLNYCAGKSLEELVDSISKIDYNLGLSMIDVGNATHLAFVKYGDKIIHNILFTQFSLVYVTAKYMTEKHMKALEPSEN